MHCLPEIGNIEAFENIVIAIFVIRMSEWLELNSHAWKKKKFLDGLIETLDYKKVYTINEDGHPFRKAGAKNQESL